jgi:hypothetical protein
MRPRLSSVSKDLYQFLLFTTRTAIVRQKFLVLSKFPQPARAPLGGAVWAAPSPAPADTQKTHQMKKAERPACLFLIFALKLQICFRAEQSADDGQKQ